MYGIPIYAPDCKDFTNNGEALLFPTECIVSEALNGEYSIRIVIPITSDGRWQTVRPGSIVKAICPVKTSPETIVIPDEGETITQSIYRVSTSSAYRLNMRDAPNQTTSHVLGSYARGTLVLSLESPVNGFRKVTVLSDGATGYMADQYLAFDHEETTGGGGESKSIVMLTSAREQLFRIFSVNADTAIGDVTIEGMHIFYDLRGNLINGAYTATDVSASVAVATCFSMLLNDTPFVINASNLTGKISGEYSWMNPVEALLDETNGIVHLAKGTLVRDNFTIYAIDRETTDNGITIRRGKNIEGLTLNIDDSEIITRIVPCGKNANGDDLYIGGTNYIDSENIGDYAFVKASKIDYGFKVGDDGYKTESAVIAALRKAARDDFAAGCDIPTYGIEVNFRALEMNADFEKYKELQTVSIGDYVTVIDEVLDLKQKIIVTAYEWDALTETYNAITLGDFDATKLKYWGTTTGGESTTVERPVTAMTEQYSADCVATSSTVWSSTYAPYKAFDFSLSTSWASAANDSLPWLQLEMDVPVSDISVYVYSRAREPLQGPIEGYISGSNDGETWENIGAFSNWNGAAKGALLGIVKCGNATPFRYVRMTITRHTNNQSYVCIGYVSITGIKEVE